MKNEQISQITKVNKMITKDKYFEIVGALKEQIKVIANGNKKRKIAYRKYEQNNSKCFLDKPDNTYYWCASESKNYKRLSEFYTGDECNAESDTYVTTLHILYNRIRKRPAHTGSYESDEAYLILHGTTYYGQLIKCLFVKHTVKCEHEGQHLEMFEIVPCE